MNSKCLCPKYLNVHWFCDILFSVRNGLQYIWWCSSSTLLYGPRQANLVLITYASSEGSGEPAHPRSLARTFAARSYKQ